MIPRLAVTPGEPAGIGPDIVLHAALRGTAATLVCIGDPTLLSERARALGLPVQLDLVTDQLPDAPAARGRLWVSPVPLATASAAGVLDPANAHYVLETLDRATDGCLDGRFDGMVTGPVNKAIINDAGVPFSGHTEYLARRTGTDHVVMMLANRELRVALATTHLPLRAVSDALSRSSLRQTLDILHAELSSRFGYARPRIMVLGLNPHAGEGGHLGREEIDVIEPVLADCRRDGYLVSGPVPADTAFTPAALQTADAVLAMYHDQGLPVLKAQGFGATVNITLGLPIVRTSVDHGTALALAGSGAADPSSLLTAIDMAARLCRGRAALS
jgi:4-hydroxythreonine-4-phosphate dehydrogenase